MTDTVYKKLAERLDALPNGFTPTESGIELKLLAKIFTPEEARLASLLRLTHESAAEIAVRAGADPAATLDTLRAMRRKGLIGGRKIEGEYRFGLEPFMVGIYEEQIGRMDKELAALFDRYYVEVRGGVMIGAKPALHRVIPVEKSIPIDITIFPYERAAEMLDNAQSWGARDCICRVQQRLIGKGCDSEVSCLLFAPAGHVFDRSTVTRAITKEEAFEILNQAQNDGLIHSTGNYQDDVSYICSCCSCCCAVMRGVIEFGNHAAVARSDFLATVDPDVCSGCEQCLERCKFEALSVSESICGVDRTKCVGCGLCIAECSTGALTLERRPEAEVSPPPQNEAAWLKERAANRHIPLRDIL